MHILQPKRQIIACFRKDARLGALLSLCMLWIPTPSCAATQTVLLPLRLNYPFIQSLLLEQLYTAPGQKAVITDETQGSCFRIELFSPEVSQEGSLLKIGTDVSIRTGVPFGKRCVGNLLWKGYIEVLQRVVPIPERRQIRFETIDSRILKGDRQPASLISTMWDLIKDYVHPFLDQNTIDLSPPFKEMCDFLPLLFTIEKRSQVDRWLETLALVKVTVGKASIEASLSLEVETVSSLGPSDEGLSPAQIKAFYHLWEKWDALVVLEMESLIGQPITEEERSLFMEILLENRYQFLRALSEKTVGPDLVRQQFIDTWQQVSKILYKYAANRNVHPSLSYLAFLTASDALVVLDQWGPALGLEISRDGLVRLAKLLSASDTDPLLRYSYQVNPSLRQFFGLGTALDDFGPAMEKREINLPAGQQSTSDPDHPQSWMRDLLLPMAWAASEPPIILEQLTEWITPSSDPKRYLKKVRDLLDGTANQLLSALPHGKGYDAFFHRLLLATAWQESCWRQFVAKNGKLQYLISYNGTSVGLLQINERVWRGIYDVESLRWNIAYNARAGTEILHLYLRRFALKKIIPQTAADFDTLARLTYAIYNGGPSQRDTYLKRSRDNAFYKSDQLFWEKYTLVKNNEFRALVPCVASP